MWLAQSSLCSSSSYCYYAACVGVESKGKSRLFLLQLRDAYRARKSAMVLVATTLHSQQVLVQRGWARLLLPVLLLPVEVAWAAMSGRRIISQAVVPTLASLLSGVADSVRIVVRAWPLGDHEAPLTASMLLVQLIRPLTWPHLPPRVTPRSPVSPVLPQLALHSSVLRSVATEKPKTRLASIMRKNIL